MLKRISSIKDDNCPTIIHYLYARLIKTMKNTTKADKYARLFANIIKLIRTATPESKSKYSKFYKQLLVLRQIFRWQGMYEAIAEFKEKGWAMFHLSNINNVVYILFEMFGDTLDRLMFAIEVLDLKQYQWLYGRLEQMESDCYFIQCVILLLYHLRTLRKVWEEGTYLQKKVKVLRIIKYVLDSLTSYCKFSRRVWEMKPKNAAIVGITSSIIGVYELML